MIYKSITDEFFDPDSLLSSTDLSSEHKVLDLKNRIEASIIIWKRKMVQKDSKSSWSTSVRIEKRELFEERAETMLLILKHHFPGLPQSTLDISKIQYNKVKFQNSDQERVSLFPCIEHAPISLSSFSKLIQGFEKGYPKS